ncbi:MAG: hypothetical protein H7Z41_06980 [Cytophagales bacterium]|nr:hypothetical protein [Armatimonadota bacterium]
MIRVFYTVGTWQLLTLTAALQEAKDQAAMAGDAAPIYEDYLVVYETGGVPDEFKQILHQMAEVAWPWKRIVSAYDLLTNERKFSQQRFDALRAALEERVGVPADQVEEVWVCFLTRPAEKIVFETYQRARVVLFEDGLTSYIPVPIAMALDNSRRPRLLRPFFVGFQSRMDARWPVWRFRRSRRKLDIQHLARVTGAYLQLAPELPAPETLARVPRQFVAYRHLREVLERVARILPDDAAGFGAAESESAPNRLLVLGQALSRNGIMTREEEMDIYLQVFDTLLSKGYQILWKEHPRIRLPFFTELKARMKARHQGAEERVQQLSLPHPFPVELVAERLELAGCVAGTSAALFYLRRLYNIPCYTFADALLPRMKGADVFMGEMVQREAPPLSQLPQLSQPPGLQPHPAPAAR